MQRAVMGLKAKSSFCSPLALCENALFLKSECHETYFCGLCRLRLLCSQQEGLKERDVGRRRRGAWPPFCGFLRDVSGVRAAKQDRGT